MINSNSSSHPINLILADNNKVYINAFRNILQDCSDIILKEVCCTMDDLSSELICSGIDVLIIDTIMFENGVSTGIREIKSQYPNLKIIGLYINESSVMREQFVSAGAHEYVSKLNGTDKLFEAIRCS